MFTTQLAGRPQRSKSARLGLLAAALAFSAAACGSKGGDNATSKFPGTEEGARQLLQQFLASSADTQALSKQLRPSSADYAAVFDGDAAKKAEAGYSEPWDKGLIVVAGKPGQTEILLSSATSEDLQANNDRAKDFPGGYAQVASMLKPGVTLYRFKFVEPGKTLGMAYDGLIHINGHWVLIPKPWRVLAE